MDPSRKRKVRFVVALSVAVLLAGGLVYTSFSASSEARTPSQLMTKAEAGKVYKLTGKVEPGHTSLTMHQLELRLRHEKGPHFKKGF